MKTKLILKVHLGINDAERRGFANTAEAMRLLLRGLLSYESSKQLSENPPDLKYAPMFEQDSELPPENRTLT